MKKITKEVLDLYVEMVATLTESSVEATERMLDLYYQIRSAYEEGQKAEKKPAKAPGRERAGLPVAQKPEKPAKAEQKELSPSARAAVFKRETLERLRKALKEKGLSYPKIAEASGLEENRLIRMMEGKPEPVEAYRRVAAGLDKLEG